MNNLQTGQASKQELLPLLLSVSLEFRTQNLFRFLLLMPTWLPTSSPRAGSAGSAPRGPRPPAPQPGTLTRCCWMLAWRSSACGLVRTRWLEPQLRRWMLPTAVQAISHLYLPPPPHLPTPLASSLRPGHQETCFQRSFKSNRNCSCSNKMLQFQLLRIQRVVFPEHAWQLAQSSKVSSHMGKACAQLSRRGVG